MSARATDGLCAACLLAAALSPDDEREPDERFPYRIVTLLGGDSDAVTYLARTTSGAPKYVALKVLRSCSDPDAVVSSKRPTLVRIPQQIDERWAVCESNNSL